MPATATVNGLAAPPAERPSLLVRLTERIRGWHLDHELARGVDPAADPALALHARRLLAPKTRARIAGALEHLLQDAHEFTGLSSRVPLSESAILAAGPERELIAAVRNANRALRAPELR